ncbi:RNA polymerase sigma factor [Planctomycetota bacterium]
MDSGKRLEKLVRRCQKGDRKAWETVFTEFQPRLRYYLRRLDASHGADDLLQDVWTKALHKIDTLREPRAFVAWLYRIARNELFSQGRVRDAFVEISDEQLHAIPSESEPEFIAEQGERIHQALTRLKPHQREVLTLSFMEALSHQQIAGILDIKPGTVKSRIFHAKQSLRRVLERSYE